MSLKYAEFKESCERKVEWLVGKGAKASIEFTLNDEKDSDGHRWFKVVLCIEGSSHTAEFKAVSKSFSEYLELLSWIHWGADAILQAKR